VVRVCDLAGRIRGTAFHVDRQGTLLTAHEVVDGLRDLLLTWPGGATRRLEGGSVTPLPELGLALLHTDAVLPPLPLAVGRSTRLVSLPLAEHALQGGIAGLVTARYEATDRWHLIADVWLLELDQAPYGLPVHAAGTPVLDAETGAVVAVATVALRSRRRGAVLAVPLGSAAEHRAVADLLARNAETVPAHGRALNLAGALDLCAATLGPAGPALADGVDLVDRPDGLAARYPEWDPDRTVLALVGAPGSGRSTELAALARQRAEAAHRLPTVRLRGADLHAGDHSALDAVDRVLLRAERVIRTGATVATGAGAEQVCRVAAAACRPLLIMLDAPEEMPSELYDRLPEWSAETGRLLRRYGARLVIGCGPEHWEHAGPLFSAEDLYGCGSPGRLTLGPLTEAGARAVAAERGLTEGDPWPLSRHPLALRLLADVRAAVPGATGLGGTLPGRAQLFGAWVDLACLRIAQRLLPAPAGPAAGPRPRAARYLAAAVAGRVHEAARRMLGPGGGALRWTDFDELFPTEGGWAAAVRSEGLLIPAGPGYRFAHEELSEWLQGGHLDLGAALDALLGDGPGGDGARGAGGGAGAPGGSGSPDGGTGAGWAGQAGQTGEAGGAGASGRAGGPNGSGVPGGPGGAAESGGPGRAGGPGALGAAGPGSRGTHRRGGPRGVAVPTPPPPRVAPSPSPRPLPHHRIGPVREALLRLAGEEQPPGALDPWLSRLMLRLDGPDAAPPGSEACWWSASLLTSVLLRLPDARPYLPLLRALAERMAYRAAETGEQPVPLDFWAGLPLPVPELMELLRLLVRSAGPPGLDAVARLLRGDPAAALPALCGWLRDERVAATAAQLLRLHRRIALDDLAEALVEAAHPRADALLRELAATEPSALCRAVDRWAHDPRPERHVAAAVHGPAVRAESEVDRRLLCLAAEALLAREAEAELHGAALALLIADPGSRARYLPAALVRYAAADPLLRPHDLCAALDTHPDQVLAAFAVRLAEPGEEAAAILLALGAAPAPRARAAAARLVGDHLDRRPEAAGQVAAWLEARSRQSAGERPVLLDFARRAAAGQPAGVRATLLSGLVADPTPLGRELLALLRVAEPMPNGEHAHGRL